MENYVKTNRRLRPVFFAVAILIGVTFLIDCSRSALDNTVFFEYGKNRAEEAFYIHKKAHMLDIIPVKFCFFLNFKLVSAVNLRPAGKPRTYVVCAVFVPLGNQVELIP